MQKTKEIIDVIVNKSVLCFLYYQISPIEIINFLSTWGKN